MNVPCEVTFDITGSSKTLVPLAHSSTVHLSQLCASEELHQTHPVIQKCIHLGWFEIITFSFLPNNRT